MNKKKCTKEFQRNFFGIMDDFPSITCFIFAAEVGLLYCMEFYLNISKRFPDVVIESGLIFTLLQVTLGMGVKKVYNYFFSKLQKWAKTPIYYELNSAEISWTWLVLCFVSGILFWAYDEKSVAYTFLSIDISYFFWLDSDFKSIKEKILSIKELKKSFLACIISIIMMGVILWNSESKEQFWFILLGVILGIIIGMLIMRYFSVKSLKKWMKKGCIEISKHWILLVLISCFIIKVVNCFMDFIKKIVMCKLLSFMVFVIMRRS